MQIAKMVAAVPLPVQTIFALIIPTQPMRLSTQSAVKYIHYPKLRDDGTIPDVFTLYVKLKRRDGQ